jgi:hypothetical protein
MRYGFKKIRKIGAVARAWRHAPTALGFHALPLPKGGWPYPHCIKAFDLSIYSALFDKVRRLIIAFFIPPHSTFLMIFSKCNGAGKG